ncbi:glycosyltransferase [Candidatus Pacearchaeota archaeon]|nr:glycosyltransferase [Candidatus Pacearchaeota archaeon]
MPSPTLESPTKTEKRIILPDTSLCAIVRDEMINPAQLPGKSGIRSFVESHVPYVEQAVVVDTGSVDGTRQELEQLAAEFPNLRVYDRPFDNYVYARNHSLTLVPTKRALVLDVDELVREDNFRKLLEIYKETFQFVHFGTNDVEAEGYLSPGSIPPIKLVATKNATYRGNVRGLWEFVHFSNNGPENRSRLYVGRLKIMDPGVFDASSQITIFHFQPGKEEISSEFAEKMRREKGVCAQDPHILKKFNWYDAGNFSEPPSKREGFKYWKQPNPHRGRYS